MLLAMVTLHRGAGWKIAIYGREHGVPHFHVVGVEFRCSIAISTLQLLAGEAPSRVLDETRRWARTNKALLDAKWRELNG